MFEEIVKEEEDVQDDIAKGLQQMDGAPFPVTSV